MTWHTRLSASDTCTDCGDRILTRQLVVDAPEGSTLCLVCTVHRIITDDEQGST